MPPVAHIKFYCRTGGDEKNFNVRTGGDEKKKYGNYWFGMLIVIAFVSEKPK